MTNTINSFNKHGLLYSNGKDMYWKFWVTKLIREIEYFNIILVLLT